MVPFSFSFAIKSAVNMAGETKSTRPISPGTIISSSRSAWLNKFLLFNCIYFTLFVVSSCAAFKTTSYSGGT